MIMNLIDISNKTSYQGEFSGDIMTSSKHDTNRTNLGCSMLDIESKNMNQKQLIEILRTQFNGNVELLARQSGCNVDNIYKMLAGDFDSSEWLSNGDKKIDQVGDSIQLGDKYVEIINSGDGVTNNYAGLLNNLGIIREQKMKISDLQKLIKEKDEVIATQKEMIEWMKSKE